MNKIEARILYNEIREQGVTDGLYVWVDPDEQSVIAIQRLMRGAPFKLVNSTEYHTTVLFHKGELPEGLAVPADRQCSARVVRIEVWTDHKGRKIAVLILDSPGLQKLHTELLEASLTHSFPDYVTHMTIGKEVTLDATTRDFLRMVNTRLRVEPLDITFDAKLKGSSLA